MIDLSLHILDIAENAIRADAKKIVIEILEDEKNDELAVYIEDDGKGMDPETLRKAMDPFFTTKGGKKVGLGLSLLSQAAQQADGNMTVDSKEGAGTKVKATFKISHPDTKPMGSIVETITTLIAANPAVQLIFDYKTGDEHYRFDSFQQS